MTLAMVHPRQWMMLAYIPYRMAEARQFFTAACAKTARASTHRH
jgi:hypothetical protein